MSKTPDPIDVHVGAKLRTIRKDKMLSQTDVGAALGVTFQQIQKYESGMNRISASVMFKLCQFLNVSPLVFFPFPHDKRSGADRRVNGERRARW